MPYPRTPAEESEMHRKIRNEIFDSGGYPFGDKKLNPERKRTAYEYHEWTRTQHVHSISEGSYLDMLEAEERHMGHTSYPPGHPRRESAMSGLPEGPHVHVDAGATMPASPAQDEREKLLQAVTRDRQPVRPNRFTAECADCHQKVEPGEGRIERRPEGWVTVHLHHAHGQPH